MKGLILAGCVVVGVFLSGCAEDPPKKKSTLPTTEEPAEKESDRPGMKGEDAEEPCAFCSSETDGPLSAPDPAKPTDREPTPGTTPPPPGTNPPPPAGTQEKICNSTSGDHRSVSKVTYTIDGETIKVTKLTVTVTNSGNNDKNDVDVYLTPKGGAEAKSFNSGDVLASGRPIDVKLPTTFPVRVGTKLRIDTNFDRSNLPDPSADCAITF